MTTAAPGPAVPWLAQAGLAVSSAQGRDVSNFQGKFPWASSSRGLSFGIHRMTQGLGAAGTVSPDPTAQWNHEQIAKAGLARGAYHFLDPRLDGAAQARYFVTVHNRLGLARTDMLWLDNEAASGEPAAVVAGCARAFMSELHDLCPHNPMGVYTFINFADTGHCAGLSRWPLWLAFPAAAAPVPPPPWHRWMFWQWGQRNGTDADAFNGTAAGLRQWIASFAPRPAPREHTADGSKSLRQFGEAQKPAMAPQAVLHLTAEHRPFGKVAARYVNAGDWDALMPAGMVVWSAT